MTISREVQDLAWLCGNRIEGIQVVHPGSRICQDHVELSLSHKLGRCQNRSIISARCARIGSPVSRSRRRNGMNSSGNGISSADVTSAAK
jgi:hypothetical protein